MSDALETAAKALAGRVGSFDGSVKFAIEDEGVIRVVDGTVSTDDGDADCTISASMDTFEELFSGDLDPTAAFMTGKIKIDGDMSVAMKLGQILA
ncbi:MAG: SCP2 sterol-binding domain-containing protein [Pseudomonadota bacterium]